MRKVIAKIDSIGSGNNPDNDALTQSHSQHSDTVDVQMPKVIYLF